MLKENDAVIRRTVIFLDAVLVAFAFLAAFALRTQFHRFYKLDFFPSVRVVPVMTAPFSHYIVVMFITVPLWCAILYLNGMYRPMRARSFFEIVWIVIKGTFLTAFSFGSIVFFFKLYFISRIFFVIFLAMASLLLLMEKALIFFIARYVRSQGYNYRRLIVVGAGRRAVDFINKVKKHPEWGFKLVGVVNDEQGWQGENISDIHIIGSVDDMPRILQKFSVDEVVFMVPRSRLPFIEKVLYVCETVGVKASIAVDLFELKIARARQTEFEGIPFITFETTSVKEWQLFIKRIMDVVLSGLGIIFLWPFFLLVSALIKITSDGPVFFIQKRVGLNGRKFILYKFRTMYKGAQKRLNEVLAMNEMQGPVFKIKNDPRITPVGRFLRRFSIDEFPQLFNVFMGHMSLVGPRPPIPKEVSQYEPWQRRRLSMRPGLTCLWQISGRNKKVDFNEWMKLDLEYIDSWSLLLDIKILLKTLPAVILGIGAC